MLVLHLTEILKVLVVLAVRCRKVLYVLVLSDLSNFRICNLFLLQFAPLRVVDIFVGDVTNRLIARD